MKTDDSVFILHPSTSGHQREQGVEIHRLDQVSTAARGDDFFTKEVWPKVASVRCLNCHKEGGDAEKSQLVLRDPRKAQGLHAQDEALRHNRDAFARLARRKHEDQYRLLVKVTGGLDHGGDAVLTPDSKGYLILAEFVRRVNAAPSTAPREVVEDKNLYKEGDLLTEGAHKLRRASASPPT
jgi:hypothetical protein